MKERKNVDRLFQEKLKDFEVAPDEQVWKNIEAALRAKKKRRFPPIWFRLAGAAAILLLAFFTWDAFWNTNSTSVNSLPNGIPESGAVSRSGTNSPASGEGANENRPPVGSKSNNAAKTQPARGTIVASPVSSSVAGSDVRTSSGKAGNLEKNRITSAKTSSAVASSEKTVSEEESAAQKSIIRKKATIKLGVQSTAEAAREGAIEQKRTIRQKEKSTKLNERSRTESQIARIQSRGQAGALPETNADTQPKEAVATNGASSSKQNLPVTGLGIQSPEAPFAAKDITTAETVAGAQNQDTTKVAVAKPNALEELLQQQNEKEATVAETKWDRWQVSTNIAPVYFGSASKGSPIDPQFSGNSKSYENNVSYGIGVHYAVNKRLSVRTGVNKLKMGYNTNGVTFFAGFEAKTLSNIKPSVTGNYIAVVSTAAFAPGVSTSSLLPFEMGISDNHQGVITQEMGFVEVPVEMSYKILSRRFSVSVIGGLSTLFLNENNVSVSSSNLSFEIGEAKNLNDVHFSSNLGLGFRYRFYKNLELHCEPTFKYQFNTFSAGAGNFKPYVMGVYSGLSLSF